MDKLDLQVLAALAETESISKAADILPLSYSSINTRLGNLENEVGVPLFARTSKGTKLTSAGMKFYYFAYKSLLGLEAGIHAAREDGKVKKDTDTIKIGITRPLAPLVVPIFTKLMQTQSSFGKWQIITGDSLDLLMLTNGEELQMSVVNQNLVPSGLEQIELFEEMLYLIGPKGEQLPRYDDFFHILERIPLILLKRGFPLRELIEENIFKPIGFVPKQLIEVDTAVVLKEMVKQGIGYTLIPLSFLWSEELHENTETQIAIYPDVVPKTSQKFCLTYSPRTKTSHQALLDYLSREIKKSVVVYRKRQKARIS